MERKYLNEKTLEAKVEIPYKNGDVGLVEMYKPHDHCYLLVNTLVKANGEHIGVSEYNTKCDIGKYQKYVDRHTNKAFSDYIPKYAGGDYK